jgi:hypothetical protein
MFKRIATLGLFIFAAMSLQPALAATDPTVHEIYAAAEGGNVAQARQMMDQVLQDHPNSGKAHYVSAELYAKSGDYGRAQGELATAERLEPGLPFAKPESVRELRTQLAAANAAPRRVWSGTAPAAAASGPHISIGALVLFLVIGGIVVAVIMRRRRAVMMGYPAPGMGSGAYPGGAYPGGPYPGGPYPGGPPVGGGIGSGIAGGLASGLAVGAGVVAGEELAHHFLDGDRRAAPPLSSPDSDSYANPGADNTDMGGSDFGVSDSDSWDDGGSGGDGGGGDWS